MDISIVIPTYNRKERLRQCLESLFQQDWPKENFEIIVIDDGSSDGTQELLKEFSKRHPNLRRYAQQHKGPAAARNLGMTQAKAEIVGFTDNDCILRSDWVKKMVSAHMMAADASVIGGLTRINHHNIKAVVSQFLSDGAIEANINGSPEIIFFPTCNVSLKKDYLNRERFNESFRLPAGEDLEFFWRLYKKGHGFIYRKDIEILHNCHSDFKSFIRQAYMYGRGNFLVQHLHSDHPLLRELKIRGLSFWCATMINFIKIPRFSYLLGKRLIKRSDIKSAYKRLSVYLYFTLHKICYLIGNIVEFCNIKKSFCGKNKPVAVPRLLILDITHSCNLNCRICDIWQTASTEKDLDICHIKKMLFQAKELGIVEVALSGGEPLLRENIFEIFEYARNTGIKNLGVLTNGILIERYLERLKPHLIGNTISPVVSLDSLRPGVHNHIRNSDSAWQKSTEALRLLSLLKKQYPEINFNVISVILNHNLEELSDLAIYIKGLAANSLQFQALLPNNLRMAERRGSDFWVPEQRLPVLDEAVDRLIEFKLENPHFIRNSADNLSLMKKYFRGKIKPGEVKCVSADKAVLISNKGECSTCFATYGSIKMRQLEEILMGDEIISARKKVKRCAWPCLLPCFCDL